MATQTLTATIAGSWFDQAASPSTARATAEQNAAERNAVLYQAQQRARRGPTPEVFFAKYVDNTRLVKAEDPVRKREMKNFAIAMTILFAMVMVYGWQHFSAIEYGYKVEAKKQQLEHLRETNRQLSLKEAQMCDLGRLDREAKRLGMDAPRPGQVVRPDLSPDGTPGANPDAALAVAHFPNMTR